MALFIGLMSGTSLDGVDAVLADISPAADSTDHSHPAHDLAFVHLPFSPELRAELWTLNRPGDNELHRAALAGNALARLYGQAVQQVLAAGGVSASQVSAVGAHGQTVRHRPQEFDGSGYTLQLLNGALLAELTGIDVVCDLRSRDLAAGGQGAPLVPAFHAACFARSGQDVAVLNLGGIANLSLLPAASAGGDVLGFDCGPANVLMDLWCQRKTGQPFDAAGAWAAAGRVDDRLLAAALAAPYFALQPPKSTGRDLFDGDWLDRLLTHSGGGASDADVMATLVELTARTATEALKQHAPRTSALLVCGGGAHNQHLMQRLSALLGPGITVNSTASAGMAPELVEGLAFAWLAQRFLARAPGNLPAVTGARGPRVLGALYPAR